MKNKKIFTRLFIINVSVFFILSSSCRKEEFLTRQPASHKKNTGSNSRVTNSYSVVNAVGSTSLWPASNSYDANNSSSWSGIVHANPTDAEYLAFWFTGGFHDVNYVKLLPRYVNNTSAGFPINFTIYYSSGGQWHFFTSYTNFGIPNRNDWIILSMPFTVNTDGIEIFSTYMGKDDVNNNVFQMAEVGGGFDSDFDDHFKLIDNNGVNLENQIINVGSDEFDPNKISNWNYDIRFPLILPAPPPFPFGPHYFNIYAPSIVYNGCWNIYYGGWDGGSSQHDQIYIRTTYDDFITIDPPYPPVIGNGIYDHVNNSSVIKLSNSDWRMNYTTFPNANNTNKPCYATSPDGLNWTPHTGDSHYLLTMNGYPYNWSQADVNGSNVLLFEHGIYHMYFTDFKQGIHDVYYATSVNGRDYTYVNSIPVINGIANDVKKFQFNNSDYYFMAMHSNNQNITFLMGSDVNFSTIYNSPGSLLFRNQNNDDHYITSIGLVANQNRLYGALYGAGSSGHLNENKIFAMWLQKKVIFKNNYVRWGDIERAYGPDRIVLFMDNQVETGNFYVYDTDGTTLLYTSPLVTMRSGDIWSYIQ